MLVSTTLSLREPLFFFSSFFLTLSAPWSFSHPRISFIVHLRVLKPEFSPQILDKHWKGLALLTWNEGMKVCVFLFQQSLHAMIPCHCTNYFIHNSYAVMSENQPNGCWKLHIIHIPCGLDVNYFFSGVNKHSFHFFLKYISRAASFADENQRHS